MRRHVYILLLAGFLNPAVSWSQSADGGRDPFNGIIHRWYSFIGNGDTDALSSLLADDFQLIAFGKRFSKTELIEMSKGYSNVKYQLDKVQYSIADSLGYITFDVVLNCTLKGKPVEGHAMEAYLLRKELDQWKVVTKVIVMQER